MFGDLFAPKDFPDGPRPFLTMTKLDLRQFWIGLDRAKPALDGCGADVQLRGDPFNFPSLDPTESCQFG
jgi:hypothetical protein